MKSSRPLCSLLLFSVTSFAFAAGAENKTLDVGDISSLNLEQMSGILGPELSMPVSERRPLSLDEALREALGKNLRIDIATLDVETAEPEVDATRARFHPTLGADGAILETRDDFLNIIEKSRINAGQTFIRQEVPTGGTVTVGGNWIEDRPDTGSKSTTSEAFVEVRQPLMRGGRIYVARRFIEDAKYDLDIQQARLAAEVLDVSAQTKIAYFNTVLSERLIDVVAAAVVRDKELVKASNALFDAGRVNKRDVVSAEIQLSQDQIELASREAEREVAQNLLRDVLGTPIGVYLQVTDREIPFRPIEIRLVEWVQAAFENRPELLEIRKRIEKAELEKRVRKNDILPIVDFLGTYREDYRASDGDQSWQVGGLVEIPLGNVAARRRFKRAKAQQARVEREYVQRERAIELEVREIEIRLRESIRRLRGLIRGVEQARAKNEIARARFELGQANNLDITDATEDLVNAESDLLRAVVDYANNIALLEARIASPI